MVGWGDMGFYHGLARNHSLRERSTMLGDGRVSRFLDVSLLDFYPFALSLVLLYGVVGVDFLTIIEMKFTVEIYPPPLHLSLEWSINGGLGEC